MILHLFDNASQGTSALLNSLKTLFQCEDISIADDINSDFTTNDIHYQIDSSWPTKQQYAWFDHSCIRIHESRANQFILTINQEENVYLKIQFQHQDNLEHCLSSHDIAELIPHIQQAILIANKISQQQGDICSLNYVISNHPCKLFDKLDSKASLPYLTAQEKEAANTEIDFEIERERLVRLFSFTPTETELVKLFFLGLSIQKIADCRSVSKQTVRKQLQSILKKTHCDSQEALMLIIFDAIFTGLQKPKQLATNDKQAPIKSLMAKII